MHTPEGIEAWAFYWDSDRLVAEVLPDGRLRTYVYPDAAGLVPMLAVDYTSVDAEPESGEVFVLHTDHRGAIERVENAACEAVWDATVHPYGDVTVHIDEGFHQPFRLVGQYHDAETGLSCQRYRYWSGELGRFLESDPLGLAGGLNTYAWPGCPLRDADPEGLGCSNDAADDRPHREDGGDAEHEFNMIENPGPLAQMRGKPAQNFAAGRYNAVTLSQDLVLYRGGAGGGGDNALGQWFTRDPPPSRIQVRIDSAVKADWIHPVTGERTGRSPVEAVYGVRIPAGTTVYEGPVGSQGGVHVGGGNQVFVPEPWRLDGVRVVSEAPLK